MSYKHHYPMLLEIPGMIEEGPIGLTPERLAFALRAMADRVEANSKVEVQQILGRGPVSVEREDRWVLRAADRPRVIKKADGPWVFVDAEDIDLSDSVTGEHAARMLLQSPVSFATGQSIWARPENIGGLPCLLQLKDRPDREGLNIDARDFLAKGPEDVVRALCDQTMDASLTDALFECLTEDCEPAALALQTLLANSRHNPEKCQFLAELQDPVAAKAFVEECRPGLMSSTTNGPEI